MHKKHFNDKAVTRNNSKSFPALGLKFLVRICTDLGLKDVQEYAQKLMKAEKAKELKEQVS